MADATCPTGTVYFLLTSDLARSTRWTEFEPAERLTREFNGPLNTSFETVNNITGKMDVVGYMMLDQFTLRRCGRWVVAASDTPLVLI